MVKICEESVTKLETINTGGTFLIDTCSLSVLFLFYLCYNQGPCEIDDAFQYINLGYGAQAPKIVIL